MKLPEKKDDADTSEDKLLDKLFVDFTEKAKPITAVLYDIKSLIKHDIIKMPTDDLIKNIANGNKDVLDKLEKRGMSLKENILKDIEITVDILNRLPDVIKVLSSLTIISEGMQRLNSEEESSTTH